MYPIPDLVMSLRDIAQHWSREQLQGTTVDEVHRVLLAAFWQGHLSARLTDRPEHQDDSRPHLLNGICLQDDHPSLLVLRPGAKEVPMVVDLPDGDSVFDMRIRLAWPPTDGCSVSDAQYVCYEALAGAGLDDYSTTLLPIITMLKVDRTEFGSFCERRGYPMPRFWFAPRANPSNARAAVQCSQWLQAKVKAGPKPSSKVELRAEATSKFSGLSVRAFDDVWKRVTPSSWKRSGAPRKDRR